VVPAHSSRSRLANRPSSNSLFAADWPRKALVRRAQMIVAAHRREQYPDCPAASISIARTVRIWRAHAGSDLAPLGHQERLLLTPLLDQPDPGTARRFAHSPWRSRHLYRRTGGRGSSRWPVPAATLPATHRFHWTPREVVKPSSLKLVGSISRVRSGVLKARGWQLKLS